MSMASLSAGPTSCPCDHRKLPLAEAAAANAWVETLSQRDVDFLREDE